MIRLTTLLLSIVSLTSFAGDTYQFDAVHSSVLFKVSHNTVGMAWGRFNKYEGSIDYDGNVAKSVNISIDVASIDSANADRDDHLRKTDFFNAVEFPTITFKSTSIKANGDNLEVSGDLTMLGITKPVTFKLEQKGPVDGRRGGKLRGIHGSAKIKRSDFGMTYALPGVGDEVTIMVALEAKLK